MSYEFTIQRQFRVAQILQSLLLVLGVLFLGAGLGYYMALAAVADTACGTALNAPDVCSPIVAEFNEGLLASLSLGVVALLTSGVMSYGLGRVEL